MILVSPSSSDKPPFLRIKSTASSAEKFLISSVDVERLNRRIKDSSTEFSVVMYNTVGRAVGLRLGWIRLNALIQ